jgi:hypothetical protein
MVDGSIVQEARVLDFTDEQLVAEIAAAHEQMVRLAGLRKTDPFLLECKRKMQDHIHEHYKLPERRLKFLLTALQRQAKHRNIEFKLDLELLIDLKEDS